MRLMTESTVKNEQLIIGLMSGSSLDGIDAALVRVTGCCEATTWTLVDFLSTPFKPEVKKHLLALFDYERCTVDKVCLMNSVLGELFAENALAIVKQAGVNVEEIDAMGVWPQMVYHLPARSNPKEILGYHLGACLQLGDLNVIVERTGITTIGSFCARDIAVGGNGAPLTGLGDYIVYHHVERNRAIQNIGGIANVNLVLAAGGMDQVIGFDTGPGNMLIDSIVRHLTQEQWQYDHDGQMASSGRVDSTLVNSFLEDPFIQQRPPKAAGRENFGEHFTKAFLAEAETRKLSNNDIVATATSLTVEAIAFNYEHFLLPYAPIHEVVIGGGGALNPALMRMLRERLRPIEIATDDEYGIPSFAKEAIYMALITNETLRGHANNVSSVTGASRPVVMGLIAPAYRGIRV